MSAFSHIMDDIMSDISSSSQDSCCSQESCQEELERQQTILETALAGLHTSIQKLQEKLIKSTILYIRDQPLSTSEKPIAALLSKK